jgi:hypothetical protein
MAYFEAMEFIETPHFTRQVTALMPDHLYRLVQNELAQNPQAGDLIPGGGGIRKIRAALPGAGKRGGTRIIYYWQNSKDRIFMLVIYAKAHKTNLDPQQAAAFKMLVKEIERHG